MKQKMFGLVLNEGEGDELLKPCIREGIPITFPELFRGYHCYLWGFDVHGIGRVDTHLMRSFSSSGVRIIHGVKELEEFFKTDECKECKKNG